MSITTQILGAPGRDNALYLQIDTGQKRHSLLVDCGEVALHRLGKGVIQEIQGLFITHGHMDHICGFDSFFRHIYSRPEPVHIFGPAGITALIHHRLQGYTWNLVRSKPGEIIVHEILKDRQEQSRFFCREAFAKRHALETLPGDTLIWDREDYAVYAAILDHRIDTLAFTIAEKDRVNIVTDSLQAMSLTPGAWCRYLKDGAASAALAIDTGQGTFPLGVLREKLLQETPGEKITYVTDCIMHAENREKLLDLARRSRELIIECTYRDEDVELAAKNYHLTVGQAAELARDAGVHQCTLFHVSDRYTAEERRGLLARGREIHPRTVFPDHWNH